MGSHRPPAASRPPPAALEDGRGRQAPTGHPPLHLEHGGQGGGRRGREGRRAQGLRSSCEKMAQAAGPQFSAIFSPYCLFSAILSLFH